MLFLFFLKTLHGIGLCKISKSLKYNKVNNYQLIIYLITKWAVEKNDTIKKKNDTILVILGEAYYIFKSNLHGWDIL